MTALNVLHLKWGALIRDLALFKEEQSINVACTHQSKLQRHSKREWAIIIFMEPFHDTQSTKGTLQHHTLTTYAIANQPDDDLSSKYNQ